MSFWGMLGDIGAGVAAPFTGGASLALIPAINGIDAAAHSGSSSAAPNAMGNVAQTAGSIEAAREKGLVDQAQLGQGQDRNAQTRYLNSLAGLKQNAAMPQQLASNSVRGDVLANAQDANISGLPSYIHMGAVSGGLRPSMMSSNTRALGGQMSRDALAHSISGDMNAGAPPPLTPLPTASGLDKGLSGVAVGGGLLNALGGMNFGSVQSAPPAQGPGFVNGNDFPDGIPSGDGEDPNPAYAEWLQTQQEGVG